MSKKRISEDQSITEGKIFAVLAYLSIFCIIPLVFKKDNLFVLKHSKQGLVIFVSQVAVFVAHIILGTWILRSGFFLLGICSFVGIIYVLRGQDINFPIISDIASKIII